MKKVLYVAILILISACSFNSDKTNKNDLVLLDISFKEDTPPSFLQVKVGESTISDVILIMNGSQYLQADANPNPIIQNRGNGLEYYYLVDHIYGDSFRFYFENDVLKRVTIFFSYLELSQLINRFGQPDFIYTNEWMTAGGEDIAVTLLYQNIGLIVTAGPATQKKEYVVSENSRIAGIHLVEINDIQSWVEYDLSLTNSGLENPSDYLYEWKGYGKLSDLYPNVIQEE